MIISGNRLAVEMISDADLENLKQELAGSAQLTQADYVTLVSGDISRLRSWARPFSGFSIASAVTLLALMVSQIGAESPLSDVLFHPMVLAQIVITAAAFLATLVIHVVMRRRHNSSAFRSTRDRIERQFTDRPAECSAPADISPGPPPSRAPAPVFHRA